MKTLITSLLLILEFIKADSAFTQKSDSIKLSQVVKEMNDTTKITLTVDQCLQIYLTGYLNGSFDYMQKGSFDIDGLWRGMIKNHRTIRYNAMFNKADSAFTVRWKDSIENPKNAEFVDEVSFNEGVLFNKVTQKQFNKRYEIK